MQIVTKIESPPAQPLNAGVTRHEDIDVHKLEATLRKVVRGEVRFDDGSRALYATDGSNYRQAPIGVVIPNCQEDIIETVAACRKFGAPVLSRGGGTSLAGQCCNVAVVMDFSKYLHHVLEIDPGQKLARVQPGTVLDDLRNQAEHYHLTFAPDPATHNHNTLGGMIGNNSCGVHSVMGGRTADNIHQLKVLSYDGEIMWVGQTSEAQIDDMVAAGGRPGQIYSDMRELRNRYARLIRQRYPKIPRRVSGYNLDDLLPENQFQVARALVGSEGTLVVVLEAIVNLMHSPPYRTLVVLGYPDVYTSGDHIMEILAHGPVGLEGVDDQLVDYMEKKGMNTKDVKLLPDGGGWLLVEFGGETQQDADDHARSLMADLKKRPHPPSMKFYDDKEQEHKVWEIRESGLGATARVPGMKDSWPGWEDSAVPPERVGDYLRDFRKLLDRHGYVCALYGHLGQGCIHCRIDFDVLTEAGIQNYRSFAEEAADLVVSYGGSISGEHGDGQCRAELLPKMFGPEIIQAFREFKTIWDPEWKMNPGKVVDPYRLDENLRLGTDYNPWKPPTHFQFPEDQGSFAYATQRCVGVGKCRREQGGTMCPSYMVTREEQHSTRGRAHLLFEMFHGGIMEQSWHSEAVKEALDLCLSCKGCKGDCPVNVDMATYKAEFLAHYYEGKRRPLHAYAIGLIPWWARIASLLPDMVNLFTQTPGLSALAKALAGFDQRRRIPRFAPETFQEGFRKSHANGASHRNGRQGDSCGKPKVILWADTFNNFFLPATAHAAAEVLEAAGYRVLVPKQTLCCGRPLYDYGMLDLAKGFLYRILDTLRPQIRAGIPLVVLEPSCASVFVDELGGLLPNDEDAKRLKRQTYLLSEFLDKVAADYRPPKLHRKAVVHGHCHHKALQKMEAEESILRKMGVEFQSLDSGCCGMAGGFGYEREHYDVSVAVGERVLLPAVRQAGRETLILADGFSCREQISQETDRHALHLAQLIQMALHQKPARSDHREYPEEMFDGNLAGRSALKTAVEVGLGLAAMSAASAYAYRKWR